MHQPVFANVQVPRPRTAPPVVFPPARHVVLKLVESRKRPLPERHDFFKNFLLVRSQRFQLPIVVVNIPTVLVNPSSTARCAIFSASSGSFTPLPSTELIFT